MNTAAFPVRTGPPPLIKGLVRDVLGTRVLIAQKSDGVVVAAGPECSVTGFGLADCLVKIRALLKRQQYAEEQAS